MIKINLLEVEKSRKARKSGGGGGGGAATGGTPTGILAIGIIGIGVAAFVFQFIRYNGKLSDMEKDVARMRQKRLELEPYIKRVDELEARRDELQKKNEAIEKLRSQRTIPVHILDEVSRALPEYLWLTGLNIKGEVLSIDGVTLQEQAISAFMKQLEASQFIGPCSLIESKQTSKTITTSTQVTSFKISAPITNPFKPKATEEDTSTTTTKKKKK